MKKLVIAILLLTFSHTGFGAKGYVSGTVEYIRVHDKSVTDWEPSKFWFTLSDVSSAGNCGRYQDRVLFAGEGSELLSLVMANYVASKPISLQYDDEDPLLKVQFFCKVRHVTAGSSPPTNW